MLYAVMLKSPALHQTVAPAATLLRAAAAPIEPRAANRPQPPGGAGFEVPNRGPKVVPSLAAAAAACARPRDRRSVPWSGAGALHLAQRGSVLGCWGQFMLQ